MKISNKISLLLSLSVLFCGLIIGLVSYYEIYQNAILTEEMALETLTKSRKASLNNYLHSIEEDIKLVSDNETTREAVKNFSTSWEALGADPKQIFKHSSIKSDAKTAGPKNDFDEALDNASYTTHHERYHAWYKELAQEKEYGDVYIFDVKGNLIYSVFKKADFATNLQNGEYANSNLSDAFQAALASGKHGDLFFFDFKGYAANEGKPAAFISTAIRDETGTIIGVLAYKMPVRRINEIMKAPNGLGETGESYIVGSDGLLRSNLRHVKEDLVLKEKKTGPIVDEALAGKGGNLITTVNNKEIFFHYEPYQFLGTSFSLVTQKDSDEIMAPVNRFEVIIMLAALAVMLITIVAALLFSKTIVNPIKNIAVSMGKITGGHLKEKVGYLQGKDEVSDIARALDKFRLSAIDMENLKEEQLKDGKLNTARTEAHLKQFCLSLDEATVEFFDRINEKSQEMSSDSKARLLCNLSG